MQNPPGAEQNGAQQPDHGLHRPGQTQGAQFVAHSQVQHGRELYHRMRYAIISAVNSRLSAPVLVLNANFAPIHVCNVRRAVGLIMQEKATLVLNGRGHIRTVREQIPIPSIIRLSYMVKRPRPIVKLNKQEIFRRDGYTCQYCGVRPARPTLDHVVPRHLGGEHSWENLVTACPSCNLRKGGRTVEQANMRPRLKPISPPATADYIFGKYLKGHEEWEEFVSGW